MSSTTLRCSSNLSGIGTLKLHSRRGSKNGEKKKLLRLGSLSHYLKRDFLRNDTLHSLGLLVVFFFVFTFVFPSSFSASCSSSSFSSSFFFCLLLLLLLLPPFSLLLFSNNDNDYDKRNWKSVKKNDNKSFDFYSFFSLN